MKVTKEETKKETFKPFNIVFTIETPPEARALFAIFNHVNNVKLLPDYMKTSEIRTAIGNEFQTHRSTDEIAEGVTHSMYYR